MNRRRQAALACVLGACFFTTCACTDDGPAPPAEEPTSGTSSPTKGPVSDPTSTSPATEEQQAAEAAEAHIRAYTAFRDEVLADPRNAALTEQRLRAYLQDPELAAQVAYLADFTDQGFTTNGGATTFESIEVTDVKLVQDKKDAAVSIRACYNYDDVVTLDRNGEDAAPNQISPGLATYEVYNYNYPSPDGWRIAVENILGKGCP